MKIETKLDVGQTAWFMSDNKPTSAKVTQIQVRVADPGSCTKITGPYYIPFHPTSIGVTYYIGGIRRKEDQIHASLLEMMTSMMQESL